MRWPRPSRGSSSATSNPYRHDRFQAPPYRPDRVCELQGRVQAGAVDARTPTPFAAFTVPEETPVRTLHGIAGYVTTFEVAVCDGRYAAAEQLKHRIIAALEGAGFEGRRSYLRSSATEYYADGDLHGITLTFRII